MVDVASDSNCYGLLKDSGVESLGVIPQHWKISRFRNLFSFAKGLNITKDDLQDAGIPCVNYGDVHSRFGFEVDPEKDALKCVRDEFLKDNPSSLVRVGDFIFADTSEDIEGSGNFSQLTGGELVFAGYHTIIARPIAGCARRYLAYMLDSVAFRDQIRRAVKGVKVYSITQSILKDPSVWLPPVAEQKLIADYLDRRLVDLSQAIQIKERQIERLKERKQMLIQQAVTRGLDPDAPMRDSCIEWIGEIPAHWNVQKVKHLSNFITSGPRGWSELFSEVGAYFLQSGNLNEDMGIELDAAIRVNPKPGAEGLRTRLQSNDVLVCITGAKTGKASIAENIDQHEVYINQHLALIRPSKTILPKYLALALYSGVGQTYFFLQQYGIKQGLSLDDVKNALVLVPPKKEQEEIASYIEEQSKLMASGADLLGQQITKLKEYKATLINSAVTGKIKVPGVVEPAEIKEREIA